MGRFTIFDVIAERWFPRPGCPSGCEHDGVDGHRVALFTTDDYEEALQEARRRAQAASNDYGFRLQDAELPPGDRVIWTSGRGFGAWPSKFDMKVEIICQLHANGKYGTSQRQLLPTPTKRKEGT